MRRSTFVAALIVAALVIGYGGLLSAAPSTSSTQTGKPGEAPKP
ncbi:hypothetical protein OG474_44235 [Kribbella sp. NBC_01505]